MWKLTFGLSRLVARGGKKSCVPDIHREFAINLICEPVLIVFFFFLSKKNVCYFVLLRVLLLASVSHY